MRIAAWTTVAVLLGVLGACRAPPPRAPAVPPVGATPEGPFVPEAQALFDGCTPLPDSPTSRTWRCDSVSVWLDELQDVTAEAALEGARARVAARLGAGVHEVRGELPLAGRAWPSYRFAACAGKDGAEPCRAGGYYTVVAPSGGRLRQLGCVVKGNGRAELARCLELFESLASHGNPEGDVLDPAAVLTPPRLPWRVLAVPEGCQLAASTTRSGRIRCETATFSWSVFRPARKASVLARWRDQSVAELHDAVPGAGPVEEVDCRLEVLPTRCLRFTAPGPRGDIVVWAAAVEWKDRALFAACGSLASEPSFPLACNGAFSPR